MYISQSKIVLEYLKFLLDEYGFNYRFQMFDSFHDFHGPIEAYSFYNRYGCFTLHHIVQRGEWELYISDHVSTNQSELTANKIDLTLYISRPCWRIRTFLKRLSYSIKYQISSTGHFFGIQAINE